VDKYKIPHHLIEFEVTESAYITNNAKTVFILNQLKDHGFSISMDDFGSGYSSLNFLKDMPVDVLKIDRLFLKAGINDFKLRAIIKSIVTMAHEIDITLVCEGVETEEQLKFLEEIGCEVAQGYYFAKPMPVADVEHFIKTFK
jgi:EAL domain-containing protein (putative c-di-GMP-specific phosphodiesterase class I)